MKKFRVMSFGLIVFLALVLVLSAELFAGDGTWSRNVQKQSTVYGQTWRFTCTVDSLDTLTSSSFTLGKFDAVSWTTMPFSLEYLLTSVLGTAKITGYVQGSFDGSNWHAVDTLFTDFTTETRTRATIDLNNHKRPYYRVIIYGVALNRPDTVLDLYWYAYQESY